MFFRPLQRNWNGQVTRQKLGHTKSLNMRAYFESFNQVTKCKVSQIPDTVTKSTRYMFFMYFSGNKKPCKMTNWGEAAFTETELNQMEKIWQENKNRSLDGQ